MVGLVVGATVGVGVIVGVTVGAGVAVTVGVGVTIGVPAVGLYALMKMLTHSVW